MNESPSSKRQQWPELRRPSGFEEFQKRSINQGIHQRFEEIALLHGSRIALKTEENTLTYAELNTQGNCLAEAIMDVAGVGMGQAALLLPNSSEMVVSMLSALKAGKAYVPMDGRYPRTRLKEMLEDSQASILLTDGEHNQLAEEISGNGVPVVNISEIARQSGAPNPNLPCDPLDRAYILYTSGSTGRPKGIEFRHRNLLHSTMCLTNRLHFSPSDRVTWLHSASFAASVVDIYCCLCNGGALYPWDVKARGISGMTDWLKKEKISTLQWIPSAFRQFLRTVPDGTMFEDIRIVVMASEPLTRKEVDVFREFFPLGSQLINQMGTSESYNFSLFAVHHDTPLNSASVPGGYPVSDDREILILDEQRGKLGQGDVGEVAVRSEYMAAGYWRDAELTRTKFIDLDGSPLPVFLTGDLGRIDESGCLHHLGRKDMQVKIRGHRVELAEVDFVLASAPGVSDCVTWIAKNRRGEDTLVGYVTRSGKAFNERDVLFHLESRLPDFMVPKHYVVLDAFPRLPSGKIDRKSLPDPFCSRATRCTAHGSEEWSRAESNLVALFEDLLKCKPIDVDSNFVEFGGDSLLAGLLLHRIRETFGVEIAYADLPDDLTPRSLARAIVQPGSAMSGATQSIGKSDLAYDRLHKCSSTRKFGPVRIAQEARSIQDSRLQETSVAAIRDLVIIGAGQFAHEVLTWATQAIASGWHCRIKGFLDRRADALKGYEYEAKLLGDINSYEPANNDVFVGAIGDPKAKLQCYERIAGRGGEFINVLHPLSNIGMNVKMGGGVVLAPYVSLTCGVEVGNHVTMGAFSNAGHGTIIGDGCQISSHCGINGTATLGDGVFLGSHSCILPGVKVGAWAYVGAGSVVVRDVPEGARVFGNPACIIGRA